MFWRNGALGRADWGKFEKISNQGMQKVKVNQDVDEQNNCICETFLGDAKESISRMRGKLKRKTVTW